MKIDHHILSIGKVKKQWSLFPQGTNILMRTLVEIKPTIILA